MSRHLARAGALALLVVAAPGCRSAFAPEPVLRLTTHELSVPATTSRQVVVRSGPADAARAVATLPAGAEVQAAGAESRGFRRVRTADGVTGFVEAAALTDAAAAARPAQPASPAQEATGAAPAPAPAAQAPAAAPAG